MANDKCNATKVVQGAQKNIMEDLAKKAEEEVNELIPLDTVGAENEDKIEEQLSKLGKKDGELIELDELLN